MFKFSLYATQGSPKQSEVSFVYGCKTTYSRLKRAFITKADVTYMYYVTKTNVYLHSEKYIETLVWNVCSTYKTCGWKTAQMSPHPKRPKRSALLHVRGATPFPPTDIVLSTWISETSHVHALCTTCRLAAVYLIITCITSSVT